MPRRSGDKALSSAKQGAVLVLTDISNLSNREASRRLGREESTIRKVKKRKENIPPQQLCTLGNCYHSTFDVVISREKTAWCAEAKQS